jgi:7-carboxy-7-deazaguanine synthase
MTAIPIPVTTSSQAGGSSALLADAFVSFQGEGPFLGQRAAFVRLSRCNLACTWCDTSYTWDWSSFDPRHESQRRHVSDIARWIDAQAVDLAVVTGGEPLLQQAAIAELANLCAASQIQIETNGTIAPTSDLAASADTFVVSPKLAHSAVPYARRVVPAALTAFVQTGKACWKFVAATVSDLDEIGALVDEFGLAPVWVMPEGTDAGGVLRTQRRLADAVLARGWNLTTRLHVVLWGDQRGR